jgi:hypothetical protein
VVGDFAEVPQHFPRPFDLVCCVEVAEHIDPARSRELVTVVTNAARRWIYFTAAPPGQSGRGHINCRPHEEWLGWFEEEGWRTAGEETEALRAALEHLTRAHWLQGNSFLLAPGAVTGAGAREEASSIGANLVDGAPGRSGMLGLAGGAVGGASRGGGGGAAGPCGSRSRSRHRRAGHSGDYRAALAECARGKAGGRSRNPQGENER